MIDAVILVNKQDKPIAIMDKIDAHRGVGRRHRAVSVFLFNSKHQLLMQQRSPKKIVGGMQWANTCCGNVWPNESRPECALRRLKVELGITKAKIAPVYTFEYHIQANKEFSEWEIDEIYIGSYDDQLTPNSEEVVATTWKSKEEIERWITTNPIEVAPWFSIMFHDKRLQQAWPK